MRGGKQSVSLLHPNLDAVKQALSPVVPQSAPVGRLEEARGKLAFKEAALLTSSEDAQREAFLTLLTGDNTIQRHVHHTNTLELTTWRTTKWRPSSPCTFPEGLKMMLTMLL